MKARHLHVLPKHCRCQAFLTCGMAIALLGHLAAGSAPVEAASDAGGFEWQIATPESQGMSSQKVEAIRDDLAGRRTSALLVVRNDTIVCEWYADGQDQKKLQGTASMAKAVVGGVSLAVAMTDGLIALDDAAAKYIPQWKGDPRKSKITVRQLGSHTSGVENAGIEGLTHEQLTGWMGEFWKLLPVPNDPFTISRDQAPVMFEPGTDWAYSNPGIALMTYCVTASLRDQPQKDIRTLLRDRVMRPIGVPDEDWIVGYRQTIEVDGLPLVGSWGGGGYTPRAAARLGRLMLREGDWDGKQILSKESVLETTRDAGTPGVNGMGWWSNNEGRYPGVPKDAYFGAGAGHKVLLVVPSLNLIVVRGGQTLEKPPAGNYEEPLRKFIFKPLVEAVEDQPAK